MDMLLFFFLGASMASFIGVVVERFPEKSILFPASHCETCKNRLNMRDLIPVISQLINRSRCRFCQAKIPYWYGILEFWFGIIAILYSQGCLSHNQLFILIFSTVLSLYDLKYQEFPLLIWFLPSISLLFFHSINTLTLILLSLGVLAELFDLKIGSGDFLYLASLSLVLNLQSILWVVEIGSLLGIIYYFFQRNKRIPFVPFLFLGYLVFFIFNLA